MKENKDKKALQTAIALRTGIKNARCAVCSRWTALPIDDVEGNMYCLTNFGKRDDDDFCSEFKPKGIKK